MGYRDMDQPPQRRRRVADAGGRNIVGPRPGRRHERGDDFGGHHEGHHNDSPRRGGRSRRGDVRLAVLRLLADQPRNGYQLMQTIEERSGGDWRPSPGSMYPTLSQLEDEGLIRSVDQDGARLIVGSQELPGWDTLTPIAASAESGEAAVGLAK